MWPPKGQTNNIQFKLNLTSLTLKKKKKLSWTKLKTIRSSIQSWIPSEAHTNEILLGGLAAPRGKVDGWIYWPTPLLLRENPWKRFDIEEMLMISAHTRTRQKCRDSSPRFEIMNLKYLFLATLFSFSFYPLPFPEKKNPVELTLNLDAEMRTPTERKTNSSSNLRLCSTLIINQ